MEIKIDLLLKYLEGLKKIWKTLVDEGPEEGDPLELFGPALTKTESTLQKMFKH